MRPLNCAIASAAVLVISFLTIGQLTYFELFAAVSVAFVCAAGNAMNDYFDLESDRKDKPWRPIPSGEISREATRELSLVLFASGLTFSIPLGWVPFVFVLVVELLLFAYSAWVKKRVLLGNALVSLLLSLVVVFPAIVHSTFTSFTFLALPLFLLNFSREVVKDIGDMEGDRLANKTTFAIAKSPVAAAWLATSLFAAACFSVATFLVFWWSVPLAISLVAVVLVSIPILVRFNKAPEKGHGMMERFEKAAMLFFLAGLVI